MSPFIAPNVNIYRRHANVVQRRAAAALFGERTAAGIRDRSHIGFGGGISNTAVIWENGSIFDLNTLIDPNSGWQLMFAEDINSNGDIVGYRVYDDHYSGFLLTPNAFTSIPEASAMTLAVGFPMLFRQRHRRRT